MAAARRARKPTLHASVVPADREAGLAEAEGLPAMGKAKAGRKRATAKANAGRAAQGGKVVRLVRKIVQKAGVLQETVPMSGLMMHVRAARAVVLVAVVVRKRHPVRR